MHDQSHADHGHHGHSHGIESLAGAPPGYRRVLWIALVVNATMFLLEIGAGVASGSVSLLADAIDFLGDAANYALSLAVLAMGAVMRARAAMVKAVCMLLFGALVLGRAGWAALAGDTPQPVTMGVVGLLALAANVGVGALLYGFREGDANMRSVWLCTRNDAIGNLAVLLAAAGVLGTGTRWPDLAVAAVMGGLALAAGLSVTRQARQELAREARASSR
ncbi:MAG: putative Co/Zn/Cd cation transporter [Ramlibacter sp.]|uniref:cation transporter n=1 Tax=Ramlibacter sp. TaxID=1917967 RepID=UPI002638B48E|nr:cation transporter [Ramlibacter sp.]MDB5751776.1 putative Co/Zn/Cd cation transporter [Ramlibacter sp.]